jgi:exopolysaccharide biosynthesis WecB/TagA/CpsF family protein
MSSEVIILLDFLCLFLAASLSTVLYAHWSVSLHLASGAGRDAAQVSLVSMVLAPFILYDKRFGAVASRGPVPILIRSYAMRFTMFAGVVLALGLFSQALHAAPRGWLFTWFIASLASTALTRVLVARYLRRLQRRGKLTEVIAVVGTGAVADRLVHALLQTRPGTIDLLGIFDDESGQKADGTIKPTGNLAQLIELGKTRKIDWIVLALPPTAEQRLRSAVQRLKALSAPIGLCPQHVGLGLPYQGIDFVADSVPVSLLADRPIKRWDAVVKAAEDSLPRWIMTLGGLSLAAAKTLASRLMPLIPVPVPRPRSSLTYQFDDCDVEGFAKIAAGFGRERFGYAVTPNADHMIRLHEDSSFRALYAAATYILLDSRFLAKVLRLTKGVRLPVCTGSDLTAKLFSDVIAPDDPLILIGGSQAQACRLRQRYGLRRLEHLNPPMRLIDDPVAVEACLRFIEFHSPFRFCLLAVGAPQQEAIAQQLQARGVALGLALCIGASINFLTGDERRAPRWMQRCGIEWSFRLLQAPRRMGRRYLVRGPRIFGLLANSRVMLRPPRPPRPPQVSIIDRSIPPPARPAGATRTVRAET